MATKTRVYDLGAIALQQRKSHRRESEPPTTSRGSLVRRQEMQQKHELDCYSDCGYPTRPRPKVILSIPRAGSPWSAHHASKLQTVPVRVGHQQYQHNNGVVSAAQKRALRASVGSPFQSTSSDKTNTCTSAERRRQQRRSVGADIESIGSVSESEESCISTVGYYNGTSPAASGKALKVKVSLEPPALTRVRKERLGLSLSWPSASEDEDTDRERDVRKSIHRSPNEMSNRSRIQSRKGDKHDKEVPAFSSSPKSGSSKKSRKPSRALTFSFGSSSEKVRRGLGYLHSKVSRRPSEEARCTIPETHLAIPSSPILQSKRKSQTLPITSRSTEFQRHCIVEEERDSDSSQEDWGPDLTSPNRSRHTHKRIPPPPLPLAINPSSSAPSELSNGLVTRTDSPAAYSQNSELSSRQDSMESLSTSSPSSRQDSPSNNMLTTPKQSKRERRKFSDPDLSDRDSLLSNGGGEAAPKGGGTQIKKRYTFCVRPTKQSPRPGWVS